MGKQYSEKLKTEFAPVLKFFDVAPSGNLFKDITTLAEAIEKSEKLDEKLTKYFFEFYDKDGNGTIDLQELKLLIRDIGEAMQDEQMMNLDEKEIEEAFSVLDEDKSGQIEWGEFKDWFNTLLQDDEEDVEKKK